MIRLAFDGDELDLVRAGGNLELDGGLAAAVLLSLFSDLTDEGWWGDSYPVVEGDKLGSRLWELRRARDLPSTLRAAEDDAQAALSWLIEDGVAVAVAVTATRVASGRLGLDIAVDRGDGRRWQDHWEVVTDAV